jgi:transcriptional regulator with GAF, ATPase, and Fis domain
MITADCLPREFLPLAAGSPIRPPATLAGVSLEDAVNTYERDLVLNALRQANGVQTRAAELLGTTRRILKYRMVKLNIHDAEAVGVEG